MANAGVSRARASVILADSASFVPNAPRLQVPAGPRVSGVNASFSIPNVPDGDYIVLVAFENDSVVLDPDTAIGGAESVAIAVRGQDIQIGNVFKVTSAIEVLSPNGGQDIAGAVTVEWVDDSSEDQYLVDIFDESGTSVFSAAVAALSGTPGSLTYNGQNLVGGKLYQFRVSAQRLGTTISRSEDMKGVFRYLATP
jgi:hypothetical protein